MIRRLSQMALNLAKNGMRRTSRLERDLYGVSGAGPRIPIVGGGFSMTAETSWKQKAQAEG